MCGGAISLLYPINPLQALQALQTNLFRGIPVAPRNLKPRQTTLSRDTEDSDVAPVADDVAACSASADARNLHEMGFVAGVAPVAPFPGNGGDAPGLSWRAIDQITHEVEAWADARRHEGDIDQDDLEAEVRRRLVAAGTFPEAVGSNPSACCVACSKDARPYGCTTNQPKNLRGACMSMKIDRAQGGCNLSRARHN